MTPESQPRPAHLLDLGRLPYLPAWDIQKQIHAEVLAGAPDTLLLVEHDPVLTLGANFHAENLLLPQEEYKRLGIEIIPTDRGGDVTYHGPGQLVAYPVFNLAHHGKDLHKWMRDLEETMIQTCAAFQVKAQRLPDVNTGAWVDGQKIAAIGVKVKKWVSLHGCALNVENDLAPFHTIVPCGVQTHGVTNLSLAAKTKITIPQTKPRLAQAFAQTFHLHFTPHPRSSL